MPPRSIRRCGARVSLSRQHRRLILLLLLSGSMSLFGWPILSLLPAVADQRLHGSSDAYAWMLGYRRRSRLCLVLGRFVQFEARRWTLVSHFRCWTLRIVPVGFGPGAFAALGGGLLRSARLRLDSVLSHQPIDYATPLRRPRARLGHGYLVDGSERRSPLGNLLAGRPPIAG